MSNHYMVILAASFYMAESCQLARWSESCVLIGYPSGQDGPFLPPRDFPRWSCNKSSLVGHVINPLLTKLTRSRWFYEIWPPSFLWFYHWPRLSTILTWRLVSNSYLRTRQPHVMATWIKGRDPFNQHSNRSDRQKWSTSKGGPVFWKLFRLDRTDPLSFGPKFPEILVEWIAPKVYLIVHVSLFSLCYVKFKSTENPCNFLDCVCTKRHFIIWPYIAYERSLMGKEMHYYLLPFHKPCFHFILSSHWLHHL